MGSRPPAAIANQVFRGEVQEGCFFASAPTAVADAVSNSRQAHSSANCIEDARRVKSAAALSALLRRAVRISMHPRLLSSTLKKQGRAYIPVQPSERIEPCTWPRGWRIAFGKGRFIDKRHAEKLGHHHTNLAALGRSIPKRHSTHASDFGSYRHGTALLVTSTVPSPTEGRAPHASQRTVCREVPKTRRGLRPGSRPRAANSCQQAWIASVLQCSCGVSLEHAVSPSLATPSQLLGFTHPGASSIQQLS